MEENRIPKKVLYKNLEAMRLRGRPRNRGQHEGREDVRLCGKGWKERVYNREEWKKLLRTANGKELSHSVCANGIDEKNPFFWYTTTHQWITGS